MSAPLVNHGEPSVNRQSEGVKYAALYALIRVVTQNAHVTVL